MKRALTTLQIAQFVVGASYALAHLFVAYRIPVETPYVLYRNLSTALPTLASTASAAATSAAQAFRGGDTSDWLRKLALRAAGVEGLAEHARNHAGEPFGIDGAKLQQAEQRLEEVRFRSEYATVPCIDTSGQAFAILLNVMYLAQLTGLFVRFFLKAYSKRARADPRAQRGGAQKAAWKPEIVAPSAGDAAKKVNSAVLHAMSSDRGSRAGSAYTSEASSEVENGGAVKWRSRKGLQMTKMPDESLDEGVEKDAEEKKETRSESTGETKTETRSESKTETRSESKTETKNEADDKLETKDEADSELEPKSEPAPQEDPPVKQEEEEDDNGRSFAKYAESASKDGEDQEHETTGNGERAREPIKSPEASAILVEKEDGENKGVKDEGDENKEIAEPAKADGEEGKEGAEKEKEPAEVNGQKEEADKENQEPAKAEEANEKDAGKGDESKEK